LKHDMSSMPLSFRRETTAWSDIAAASNKQDFAPRPELKCVVRSYEITLSDSAVVFCLSAFKISHGSLSWLLDT
jgi:hypothetical protein